MEPKKEFSTIHNRIASAIGVRYPEGQFAQTYKALNERGEFDNLTRDRVIVALVTYLEQREKVAKAE